MINNLGNKTKIGASTFSSKKSNRKISLSLHVMPHNQESKDVHIFSWLVGGLLILISAIIFLMIYVQ